MLERLPFLKYLRAIRQQGRAGAGWLDRQLWGLPWVLWRSSENFAKRGMQESAALSYYALFSLFPLVLLIILLIGWAVGPTATGNQLDDILGFFMPNDAATELNLMITRFIDQGGRVGLVALATLSWSALGLFSGLEGALSRTFRDTKQRPWWHRRIAGVFMILTLAVLLFANILTGLLFSFLDLIFLNQGNIWLSITGLFIPFGFSMGIFAMMYRWIPRNKVRWDAIWPAALIGALAWEVAKRIFGLYLTWLDTLDLVYGSIATVIVFMLWAFYTGCIILWCAEFCVNFADWLEERQSLQPRPNEFAHDYYERHLELPPR
jgi:membrane protein